jgi:hypothetical protein
MSSISPGGSCLLAMEFGAISQLPNDILHYLQEMAGHRISTHMSRLSVAKQIISEGEPPEIPDSVLPAVGKWT